MIFYTRKNLSDIKWDTIEVEYKTDIAELLCLTSIEKQLSLGNLVDIQDDELNLFTEDDVNIEEKRDSLSDKTANEIKEHINLRSKYFGDYYPFKFDNRKIRLKNEVEKFTPIQMTYLILLASSVLANTEGGAAINRIGHLFENLSSIAFQELMPVGFDIHIFGTGGENSEQFKGKLKSKISELATQLNISVHSRIDDSIEDSNYGDGGLDLVAINERLFAHDSHQLFFFAQCACGDNWINNQYDSSFYKWEKLLHFDTKPVSVFMTPKSLRKEGWKFSSYGAMGSHNVFIDRYLFLMLLAGNTTARLKTMINKGKLNKY